MRKGYFITFEGGEGSGKTTQLTHLKARLEARGIPLLTTREPGGTAIGDRIRRLVLEVPSGRPQIAPKTELFLYLASRAQHLAEVIQPALEAGKLVLCDRFSDATMAYQGGGRALPRQALEAVVGFAVDGVIPDLTFLLDIEVKKGLARAKGRGALNRLDQESLAFHEAVRTRYLEMAKKTPERIQLIQADESIESISDRIGEICDAFRS